MSENETDLRARLSKLEDAFVQQAEGMVTLVANTNTLVQQVYAPFLVNTALATSLQDRNLLDVEVLRTHVLDQLSDKDRDGNVTLHVNAVLGTLKSADLQAANEAAAKLKEAARARFTVFEGGDQDDEGAE